VAVNLIATVWLMGLIFLCCHRGWMVRGRAFWTAIYLLVVLAPAIVALRLAVDTDAGLGVALVAAGVVLGVGGWLVVLRRTPPFAEPATFTARLAAVGRSLLFAAVGLALAINGALGDTSLSDRARQGLGFSESPAAISAIGLLLFTGAFMTLLGVFTALVRTVRLAAPRFGVKDEDLPGQGAGVVDEGAGGAVRA
jgi:hypothetical protein